MSRSPGPRGVLSLAGIGVACATCILFQFHPLSLPVAVALYAAIEWLHASSPE